MVKRGPWNFFFYEVGGGGAIEKIRDNFFVSDLPLQVFVNGPSGSRLNGGGDGGHKEMDRSQTFVGGLMNSLNSSEWKFWAHIQTFKNARTPILAMKVIYQYRRKSCTQFSLEKLWWFSSPPPN